MKRDYPGAFTGGTCAALDDLEAAITGATQYSVCQVFNFSWS